MPRLRAAITSRTARGAGAEPGPKPQDRQDLAAAGCCAAPGAGLGSSRSSACMPGREDAGLVADEDLDGATRGRGGS